VRAMPFRWDEHPGGDKARESHVLVPGLIGRVRVADSRVEQDPGGALVSPSFALWVFGFQARDFGLRDCPGGSRRTVWRSKRHEGQRRRERRTAAREEQCSEGRNP